MAKLSAVARTSYEFSGKQPYGLERRIESIKQRRAAPGGRLNTDS